MKRRLIPWVVAAIVAGLCAPAMLAQTTSIKGYVHDVQGNPVSGAILQFTNQENGKKYELKTNNKGDYFTLGFTSGRYDLVVLKDGRQIWKVAGMNVSLNDQANVFNIDLKKEQAAQQAAMPPEVKKQQEEQQKQVEKIKNLNAMLAKAAGEQEAGNFDAAIQTLQQAVEVDPTKDLLWFKLGEAERLGGTKAADPAAKKAMYEKAVEDYKKAIAIKPAGAYYNNLGEVQVKTGDTAGAVASYNQAAQIDPQAAGQYYFNEGAVLTNTGKVEDAIAAFDKAIQADPNKADAYYWKGVNLLGKATTKGNKMEAPPGTAEAFNKYLELQPTGQFAEPAKQMLASIGASVETSFGKGKTAKTKK